MRVGPISRFLISWLVSALGLWVAAGLLNNSISYNSRLSVIFWAGLVLALVNTLVKPLVILLSLPAILFTLGLFIIVINGLMVLLVSYLYPSLQVAGLGAAILAGMLIGLVNYLVSTILEKK